jgi:peptide alpha-N-acetyltransferase
MWYELEVGDAALRLEDYPRAVTEYEWIEKHLVDMFEDQFDFHVYCLRRSTMKAYVHLLRFEDTLYSNKNFRRAGLGLVNVHLRSPEHYSIEKASETMHKLLKNFRHDDEV